MSESYVDADQNPVSTGVLFEEAKRYKTSILVSAFPNALFIGAAPAITLVAEAEYGFTPTVWPWPMSDNNSSETAADYFGLPPRIEVLPDLYEVLDFLDKEGYADTFGALVNDDLSAICKRSIRWWKLEGRTTKGGSEDYYYPWQQLDGFMVDVAGQSRHMGCHCWSTAWKRGRSYDKKKKLWFPGGPDIGNAAQTALLPGWFDTNLRSVVDNEYPDPWLSGALWADVRSVDWKTGDRNGVAVNGRKIPPNVRELLAASQTPYRLDRLPGLEWQDELADELAEVVAVYGPRTAEVWQVISDTFKGNVPEAPRTPDEAHLRWALQDGMARGILRRMFDRAILDQGAWLAGAIRLQVLDDEREPIGGEDTGDAARSGDKPQRPTPGQRPSRKK